MKVLDPGCEYVIQEHWTGYTGFPPYDPGRPCEIRVVFHHTDGGDSVRWKPAVEVVGPREVVCRGDDWWSAWQQFFF